MTSKHTMLIEEVFSSENNGVGVELWNKNEYAQLWKQARGELLGFANHLDRRNAGLTADQIRMAVAGADAISYAVEYGLLTITGEAKMSDKTMFDPKDEPKTNDQITEQDDYQAVVAMMESPAKMLIEGDLLRLFHAAIGMTTESGELFDQLKRHVYYGKELDVVNIVEELGDLLWYVALACNVIGIDMEEVKAANVAKLMTRYPQKFTGELALNRDTVAEIDALKSRLADKLTSWKTKETK